MTLRQAAGGVLAALAAALPGGATGADEPGLRALQQQQLQRQQQQEVLQLRLLQQQGAAQTPPRDGRDAAARERAAIEARQRLQQLHDRQTRAPERAQPTDDEGTRRAKAQLELMEAGREGAEALRTPAGAPAPAAGGAATGRTTGTPTGGR